VLIAFFPWSLLAQQDRELTTVTQIRSLTPEQAAEHRPVHLRGQVMVHTTYKHAFFFRDSTGGISAEPEQAVPEFKPGERVEIRGFTRPGLFAPVVDVQRVRDLGPGILTVPPLMQPENLIGGQKDSQRVSIQGTVRSAEVETKWDHPTLVLHVDIGGVLKAVVHVYDYNRGDWKNLPGAQVQIRGVCGTIFNDRRQFINLRLFVSSLSDIQVTKPSLTDPFSLPLRPPDRMLQFGDTQGTIQRIKVRGVVTYCTKGHGLIIQDGNLGVFVRTHQWEQLAMGTVLEVVGYPASGSYTPILEDAVYRIVGSQPPLRPLQSSADKMIDTSTAGFKSAPFDARLVRMQGTMLEEMYRPQEERLLLKSLKSGDLYFTVRLFNPLSRNLNFLPGSILDVTGICVAQTNQENEAQSFDITARDLADIVVLSRPGWWNAARAGWVVAISLTFCFSFFAVWMIQHRHREMKKLAMTDSLTGIFNRRAFFLLANQQWQSALRRKTPLLLFYLDIDHFKEINDTLGHKEGDMVLIRLTKVLCECFRDIDIIARMGGDEFAVFVETGDASQAQLSQRLESAVEKSNAAASSSLPLSLSVGILLCDDSLKNLAMDELVARADALMYLEKKRKRDSAA
jgi:diguanylate cyclase (GGDEF)-like protein